MYREARLPGGLTPGAGRLKAPASRGGVPWPQLTRAVAAENAALVGP